MTKFDELNNNQQEAFKEIFLRVIDRRIQEDITYTNQTIRLLVISNGAGLVLLSTFIGVIAGAGNPIAELISPLWKFLLGAVLAALIYFPLFLVSNDATRHAGDQAQKFFLNQIDLESVQGWGLNKAGRVLIFLFAILSIGFFTWAAVQCISILKIL